MDMKYEIAFREIYRDCRENNIGGLMDTYHAIVINIISMHGVSEEEKLELIVLAHKIAEEIDPTFNIVSKPFGT